MNHARFGLVWLVLVTLAGCTAPALPVAKPAPPRALASLEKRLAALVEPSSSPQRAKTLPPRSLAPSSAARAEASPSAVLAPVPEAERCEVPEPSATPPGFYPADTWARGRVVLTFDDGPHPSHTPKVLAALAKHQLPATFFLVGRNIRRDTFRLVQRMVAEGHTLGTHSYNHDVGMAVRNLGERSVEYIRGQHEVTRILIDLALVAQSEDDFDRLFTRVFEEKPGKYLAGGALRTHWARWAARHAEVLGERGFTDGRRPHPILYSRPPAGTPYVGGSSAAQQRQYASAMQRLGLLNVMWHGESGDTHRDKKHDFGFLTSNLRRFSQRGGVLLMHDYMRGDALRVALASMASDPKIEVIPISAAVSDKYRCSTGALAAALGST